jgi:alpha-ketoglutarate-dependent taurine dioxygenase
MSSHEIQPNFNPTGVPEASIYATLTEGHIAPQPAQDGTIDPNQPITVYRVEQRDRVADGTGLTSSRILARGSVAEPIPREERLRHLSSSYATRAPGSGKETSYVSFSRSARDLGRMVLQNGYGLMADHDAVIVEAQVTPNRLVSGPSHEVLLVGGVAPSEYVTAHEVRDFVDQHVDPATIVRLPRRQGEVSVSEAYDHWGSKTQAEFQRPTSSAA